MSFRLANWKSLFLAVLMPGAFAWAQARPAQTGQPILFSTPEGQIVSNSAVPLAQAPGPVERAEMPGENSPYTFHPPPPFDYLTYFPPPPIPKDLQPVDPQKTLSVITPAQIMDVPTLRQIFGLPETSTMDGQKNPDAMGLAENVAGTNIIFSGEASEDPTWAKILAENGDENAQDSGKAEKTHGWLDGLFNGPPDDNVFGNQNKNAAGGDFGPSPADETAAGEPPFDSSLTGVTPASAGLAAPVPGAAVNSGLSSPSPFALPQASTLESLPQLRALPGVPGQNFNFPPPAVPSWEPKPPPWLLSVPPPGTVQPPTF